MDGHFQLSSGVIQSVVEIVWGFEHVFCISKARNDLVFMPFAACSQFRRDHQSIQLKQLTNGLVSRQVFIQGKYLKLSDLDGGITTLSIFREPRIVKRFGYSSVSFCLQKENHPKFLFLWKYVCFYFSFHCYS